MNFNLRDENYDMICPLDSSHVIPCKRMPDHLIECFRVCHLAHIYTHYYCVFYSPEIALYNKYINNEHININLKFKINNLLKYKLIYIYEITCLQIII